MRKNFFVCLISAVLLISVTTAEKIFPLASSWSTENDPSSAVCIPRSDISNSGELFKAKGMAGDTVLFQWDNNISLSSVPSLNNGDIEASRFVTEHPCSLFALYFYLSGHGELEAHLWADLSGLPDDDHGLMTPVTISGGGLGWHTIDLKEQLGHKVYIPAMTTFHIGRLCHGSGEAKLKYSSNATPICSYWYVASENTWYYIGNSSNPLPYMIRAEGIYFNKDTIKQFTNVADQSELPDTNLYTVAIADYDKDGFDDVLCTSLLYHNDGDGTFSATGINFGGGGHSSWGDFTGDGLLDVVTATYPLKLWRNNGDGTFTNVADSMAFVDYDEPKKCAGFGDINGDGWLDLYVAYGEHREAPGSPFIYHSDHLYLNQAGTLFVEVTDSFAPVIKEEKRYSRSISFCDFDTDGDQDIYVGCYRLLKNFLLINDGTGHFTDMADEYGVAGYNIDGAYGHTIGAEWCDFDNDGDFDIIAANLAHPRFIDFSDKTYIYRNNGDGTFTNLFDSSGVEYYETHSCPAIGDYDNDGNLDLYISCVYAGYHSWLYKGNGDGTFVNDNYPSGVWTDHGWGAGWTDYDNDGDLDLLTSSGTNGMEIYRNDHCPASNNWVELNLIGDEHTNNYFAYGAQARLYLPDGRVLSRCIQGNTGTEGCMENRIMHFGTGEVTTADSLVVLWPTDDAREVLTNFAVDEKIDTIYESNAVSKVRYRAFTPNQGALKIFPNPFSSICEIKAKGQVELFDIYGKRVALFKGAEQQENTYVWGALNHNGDKLPNGVYLIYEVSSGTTVPVIFLK